MGRFRRGGISGRTVAAVLFGIALAASLGVWHRHGDARAGTGGSTATVTRGNIVLSVGGVGRIVPAGAPLQLAVAASGSGAGGATASGGFSTAPLGAVFPRAAGRLTRFLVTVGAHVRPGQPIATIEDGGIAAAAVRQARVDLAAALLELRQKQTSDPTHGLPPTAQELAAGRLAVLAAKARLARLVGPPRSADVKAARVDLARAVADLEVLEGGTPRARAEALAVAERGVTAAEARLRRLLAPPSAADVAAATADVKRAQADLALLLRPAVSPAPEALVAAQKAVADARAVLAAAQRAGDKDSIRDAAATLDEALAEMAGLLRPGPGALPVQVDAAQAAVDAARLRLAKLTERAADADVEAARLDVDRARAEVQRLKAGPGPASLAAARLAVAGARAKLAQVAGPPARADLVAARLDVRRAEADLAVLRTRGGPGSPLDVALARTRVEAARDRLASARAAHGLLTVRAPLAGTVAGLLTARGAPVDGVTPVAAVVDVDHLAVTVSLSEFDAARVKRGMKATVRVDALGGKAFTGRVLAAALTGSDANGVVTFPVLVSLPHVGGVKVGMNVSVRIVVASRKGVLRIPLEAVTRDDEDRPVVTVVSSAKESIERRVSLGLGDNKLVEIVKGLRAGEQVELPEVQAGGEES